MRTEYFLEGPESWWGFSRRWVMVIDTCLLRMKHGRSVRDGDGWFTAEGPQDAILASWFAPPCSTASVAEVIATFVGVVTCSPDTFRESVFV